MPLITDKYKELNEQMHVDKPQYGTSGSLFLKDVIQIAKMANTQDILDYGCGKSTLAHQLPFAIKQYDPAIPKYASLPEPAEIVVCTEVLEHIEEECLIDVLDHLKLLTKKYGYFTANIRPARKNLPDGRNAHICLKDHREWLLLLLERFDLMSYLHSDGGSLIFLVKNKDYVHEQNAKEKNEDKHEGVPTKIDKARTEGVGKKVFSNNFFEGDVANQ